MFPFSLGVRWTTFLQGEGGSRDSVGVPAYGSTQAGIARGIACAVVVAQHHIGKGSLLVGYQKAHKGRAVVSDLGGDPATGYGIEGGLLTRWQNAEIFSHGNGSFHFSWGNGRGYVKALSEIILYSFADFKPFFRKSTKKSLIYRLPKAVFPPRKKRTFSRQNNGYCILWLSLDKTTISSIISPVRIIDPIPT